MQEARQHSGPWTHLPSHTPDSEPNQPISNRYNKLLESPVTHTKQKIAPYSNRYKNRFFSQLICPEEQVGRLSLFTCDSPLPFHWLLWRGSAFWVILHLAKRPRLPLAMLFKTFSAAVYGIDAYLVEVEVDVGPGQPGNFNVVGLPDIAVKESRERTRAALKNCGFDFPGHLAVTVNLAPADMRKEGSAFDLPVALGLLGCQGTFFGKILDDYVFLGELSLDGSVRSVRGALSAALAARDRGIKNVVVPEANAREAAVVEGIRVFSVKSLPKAADLINSPESFSPVSVDSQQMLSEAGQYSVDLRDVRGQQSAKRALEVACAGGPEPARRCSPSASQRFCRRCLSMKPSRPRAFTVSRAFSTIRADWSRSDRIVRRTTPSATRD